MVVSNHREYEELAVALGSNTARRHRLRAKLEAARLTCPLFDTERWVRDFESIFMKMWDIHCEGNGPRTFEL